MLQTYTRYTLIAREKFLLTKYLTDPVINYYPTGNIIGAYPDPAGNCKGIVLERCANKKQSEHLFFAIFNEHSNNLHSHGFNF